MQRVLGIVVTYFPDRPADQIVERFKNDVDAVMVIDNTNNNIGIAAALNLGLNRAISEGFDWLLTMDQDSVFEEGALKELKNVAFSTKENVGIVSPFHFIKRSVKSSSVEEVPFTMTSGNLLRVSAARVAGPFEEKLFIDSVDNEYCLRLRKHGFRIIRVNQSILNHSLGTLRKNYLGSTVTHSAARRYYITRNMLYVMKKYFPKFFLFGSKELMKSFVLILLVEDDKHAKIKSIFAGVSDFLKGRYGSR